MSQYDVDKQHIEKKIENVDRKVLSGLVKEINFDTFSGINNQIPGTSGVVKESEAIEIENKISNTTGLVKLISLGRLKRLKIKYLTFQIL